MKRYDLEPSFWFLQIQHFAYSDILKKLALLEEENNKYKDLGLQWY